MNIPDFYFYAVMERVPCKTPKFEMHFQAGYYPPMEQLKGQNGKVYFYLKEQLRKKPDRPPLFLQGKNSVNITGLHDWFDSTGKLTEYAFGYPMMEPTYSREQKPNPFYPDYTQDCFLFRVLQTEYTFGSPLPVQIEWLIVKGGRSLSAAYCKQLMMGGFDNVIEELRKQAGFQISL